MSPELPEKVRESRRDQGLPEKVEDPAVLARVIALVSVPADPREVAG